MVLWQNLRRSTKRTNSPEGSLPASSFGSFATLSPYCSMTRCKMSIVSDHWPSRA